MCYHELSARLRWRWRSGLLFLLFLVTGLCAHTNGVRGAEDDTADVIHAQALSRVCQRVAESTVPSVVQVTKTQELGLSTDNPADSSSAPLPFQRSSGSGVIIEFSAQTKSAVILTSYSSVRDAAEVTVEMPDGRKFKTADVRGDPATDIAILRINGIEKAKVAEFGDSDQLKLGQLILAVGHPFGLKGSVSMGVISGKGRQLEAASGTTMIQTDASANPGSTGGPLVNLDGKVVAIVCAIASRSGGFDGVAFAVPINNARFVARQLVQQGRAP